MAVPIKILLAVSLLATPAAAYGQGHSMRPQCIAAAQQDQAAIQQALDQTSPTSGGDVWLPSGLCQIARPLVIANPNVHLHGSGEFSGGISPTSNSFNVIEVNNANVEITDLHIISYDHRYQSQVWAIHDGTARGAYGFLARDVAIEGTHSGIYLTGDATIVNPFIQNMAPDAGVGIQLAGSSYIQTITNPQMRGRNARAGILLTHANGGGTSILGGQILHMGIGLWVAPPRGVAGDYHVVETSFDGSTGPGILFDCRDAPCTRAKLIGVWAGSNQIALQVKGSFTAIQVLGGEFYDAKHGDGFDFTQATNISGLDISAAEVAGNNGYCANFGPNLSHWKIQGMTCGPASFPANGGGINIAAGTGDYATLVGNDLSGNKGTALTDASTGLHKTFASNQGIDDVIPTVEATAALPLPVNPVISVTGAATITSMTGEASTGRQVTILTAGSNSVQFVAGNNIANSISATGTTVRAVFDGKSWHLS